MADSESKLSQDLHELEWKVMDTIHDLYGYYSKGPLYEGHPEGKKDSPLYAISITSGFTHWVEEYGTLWLFNRQIGADSRWVLEVYPPGEKKLKHLVDDIRRIYRVEIEVRVVGRFEEREDAKYWHQSPSYQEALETAQTIDLLLEKPQSPN